jgi:UDP-N-acetylmuramoylalanine--D-glutamate ligase
VSRLAAGSGGSGSAGSGSAGSGPAGSGSAGSGSAGSGSAGSGSAGPGDPAHRGWAGLAVLVAGAGVSGRAAAQVLDELGARVTLADATVEGAWTGDTVPDGTELVVTSPGWSPEHPLLQDAARRGLAIWGEVELAWRLRPPGQRWLAVTGTNGKTTTTAMLAAVLAAEPGIRSAAAGNIGEPLVLAVRARPAHDLLAVELSSFQLHWSRTLAPAAAVLLNLADDHLDWHGGRAGYEQAKARIWADPATLAIANAEDPAARRLLAAAPGRRLRFGGLDGEVRVVEGALTDLAFGGGRLLAVSELGAPGPHNLANALAAAALARAAGVSPAAVASGLAGYRLGPHRLQRVGRLGGVDYVDDSKATNPHAAMAALSSFDPVVWIAGGLDKGLSYAELAASALPRLRAAVLIGSCAGLIEHELRRHSARLPVIRAASMDDAVRKAAGLARPGDTVLLAPAAASFDMFRDYAHRGAAFAAAVAALDDAAPTPPPGGEPA